MVTCSSNILMSAFSGMSHRCEHEMSLFVMFKFSIIQSSDTPERPENVEGSKEETLFSVRYSSERLGPIPLKASLSIVEIWLLCSQS